MSDILDRIMEQQRQAETITCPHCNKVYETDFCDGDGHLISFWGEDEPGEVYCLNEDCERSFFVREWVTRTFTSGKTSQEAMDA